MVWKLSEKYHGLGVKGEREMKRLILIMALLTAIPAYANDMKKDAETIEALTSLILDSARMCNIEMRNKSLGIPPSPGVDNCGDYDRYNLKMIGVFLKYQNSGNLEKFQSYVKQNANYDFNQKLKRLEVEVRKIEIKRGGQ